MRLLTEKIRSKHLNIVRLIGNVVSEVKSSSSNVKFNFRTYDKDNFHATHKVVVPSFVMKNCPISIEKDQKLFINGKLTLIDFIRDNGTMKDAFKAYLISYQFSHMTKNYETHLRIN
ncbi:uncharacterized protein LOC116352480 isoform X2 [Contarinia nasturtii]|uniref:uncharacterized protein LOC116352480 isoform X2 n=1 Tax=Contarinia nasturtii TaxID=265458 RepID=UPI0012D3BA14|nr:uncharacterized protein LOC116352480 isoform X2 [Contarinia nasturtii]